MKMKMRERKRKMIGIITVHINLLKTDHNHTIFIEDCLITVSFLPFLFFLFIIFPSKALT